MAETKAMTFLLLGKNEENTDTIILAQVNPQKKKITFISLPRDLYYRGRRINQLAQRGFEHCLKELSYLTGVPLEKYALVDVYSLISIIDLLGGIDIYLPEDLIDPSYRIKENGVWQTLAYPRGYYHLNGVQAMRIIRSRATTSDFKRSYRQQLILEALFKKIKEECAQDLNKALKLATLLISYLKTNISPLEAVQYFSLFKEYQFTQPYLIDTSNILEQTWSSLLLASDEEKERLLNEGTQEELGAWILVPKDNNWDLLRSYIKSVLLAP